MFEMDDMAVNGKNSFYCSLTLNNIRASEIVATDALKFTFYHIFSHCGNIKITSGAGIS